MKLRSYYENNKIIPTTFDISSEDKFKRHYMKRENLYVNRLCIPDMVWRNSRVLEVGCGSGENSLLYAKMGARLTLVEPLTHSIERLKKLFGDYGLQDSVKKIFIGEIENVEICEKFDIVIAEGFVNTLKKKKKVIRKLFNVLDRKGLFIISTVDTVGCFMEYFKSAIAHFYCRKNGIEGLDEKVEAIKPFFEHDFNQIPHSRPFGLWAKDGLISPIFIASPFYDFDEIIADLEDLEPIYYSSFPSYRHANDLTWHKKITENSVTLERTIDSYNLRKISFLLGEEMEEKEALKFLLENGDMDIKPKIKEIIFALQKGLYEEKKDIAYNAIRRIKDIFKGKIKELFEEMLLVLEGIEPKIYSKCTLLRRYWGTPYHYIVLRNH